METSDIDLPAYLARIGHSGDRQPPSLDFLRVLHARHIAAITFEGLDPFLGRPVAVDRSSIWQKLVCSRRGGYCYEHNGLFLEVLGALGFDVRRLGGRVMWMRPSADAPRTHQASLVTLGAERYLVDVGFGPQTPPAPLLLAPGVEQPTSHGTYRIVEHGAGFVLQIQSTNGWMPLYQFGLEPVNHADFEVANWFMSTHPRTLFVRNLIVARLAGDKKLSLLNKTFSVRHSDGTLVQRQLESAGALGHLLEGEMDLALPVAVEEIWNRLPAEPVPAWP